MRILWDGECVGQLKDNGKKLKSLVMEEDKKSAMVKFKERTKKKDNDETARWN